MKKIGLTEFIKNLKEIPVKYLGLLALEIIVFLGLMILGVWVLIA